MNDSEIDGNDSLFDERHKEAKKKSKLLNPDFEDDERALGMTTFWSMHTFLKDIVEFVYDETSGTGWVRGNLKHSIGPIKAKTRVQLTSGGDTIAIEVEDDEGEWEEVYEFRVILQPIIVEYKSKM